MSAESRKRVLLTAVTTGIVVLSLTGCEALAGVTGKLSALSKDLGQAVELGAAGADVISSISETFTPEQQYYVGRSVAAEPQI